MKMCVCFFFVVEPRILVTNRDVRAGEVIFRNQPLVVGPSAGVLPQCLNCSQKVRKVHSLGIEIHFSDF